MDTIQERIVQGVREALPAALLNAGIIHHANHGFKTGCECSFCAMKRYQSRKCGMIRYRRDAVIRETRQRIEDALNEEFHGTVYISGRAHGTGVFIRDRDPGAE